MKILLALYDMYEIKVEISATRDASAYKKTLHNCILINHQPFHLYYPPAIGTRWGLDPFPDKDGTLYQRRK